MITRNITQELIKSSQEYPVVTVLGPRQSGKTTLVRQTRIGLLRHFTAIQESNSFAHPPGMGAEKAVFNQTYTLNSFGQAS